MYKRQVLNFADQPGSTGNRIVYSDGASAYSSRFDPVVHYVSEQMSLTMAADLFENGHVEWVENVLISQDGINAPVKTLIGVRQQFISWHEIRDFDFEKGQLEITQLDTKTATINCNDPNFYPGFYLFRKLLELDSPETIQADLASSGSADILKHSRA